MQTLISLAVFAAVLGFIVFIHEWGHYYAYKKAGVKIREFSIGIGPGFTFTRKNGEKWKFSPFLIGGYVMPENVKARGAEAPEPGDVEYARPWQRFVAALAGPGVNIIAAIVLISAALMLPRPLYAPSIGEVVANSPAAEAGLQNGDRLLQVNGVAATSAQQAFTLLRATESTVTLTVQRAGETREVTLTRNAEGVYGVSIGGVVVGKGKGLSLTQAVPASFVASYEGMVNMFKGLGQLVTGGISSEQISGPAKFGDTVAKASAAGGLSGTLFLLGMLSLLIGIANLLPVPPLDGGHLVKEGLAMVGVGVPQKAWNMLGTAMGVLLFGSTLLWLGWDVIGPYWQYLWVKLLALAAVVALVAKMLFVVKE